jgi:hypothetical protein
VEGDGEQVAVQVAAEGAGAGGLAAAACGRLDVAGGKGRVDGGAGAAAAAGRLAALASSPCRWPRLRGARLGLPGLC